MTSRSSALAANVGYRLLFI